MFLPLDSKSATWIMKESRFPIRFYFLKQFHELAIMIAYFGKEIEVLTK